MRRSYLRYRVKKSAIERKHQSKNNKKHSSMHQVRWRGKFQQAELKQLEGVESGTESAGSSI
jgi:hypothetical protein